MASKRLGQVIHYYDKIGVAIVKLDDSLKQGDMVYFERGGEKLFDQEIESMQMDHNDIESASKGDEVGLKVKKEVKEGAEVFKKE